jgi:Ca2+-binding RTX toxin-like protein
MASILTGGPASPGVNLYSLLFGLTLNPGPTAGTGTSYTLGLPGSLFMTVTGAGFTYDAQGMLAGGTVETYTFKNSAGAVLAHWVPEALAVSSLKFVWSQGGSPVIQVYLKGEDVITGSSFADYLVAGIGNDIVDGGAGQDELLFGQEARSTGITVDLADGNAGDEAGRAWSGASTAPLPGTEIDTLISIESVWATKAADRLIGDSRGTTFTPDAGNDTIDGGLGEDVLDCARGSVAATTGLVVTFASADGGIVHQDSRGGTDVFTGIEIVLASALADRVTGADGRQWIVSFSGDDWFDGRAGGDVFQSGAGDDTFRADSIADVMLEQVGGGNDRVLASATHALYAGQEIERLETVNAASKAKISLAGNEFANAIIGNNGANVLDGGKGVDTLTGHGGNDTYVVDRAADAIVERKGAGKDVVVTSVNYRLGAGDEIEQIQAANVALKTPLKLTGNEFANVVFGNAGANVLNGLGGKDTLVGGKGRDLFQLTTKPGAANFDHIQDFSTRDDRIALENGVFRKLGKAGGLASQAFVKGPEALDASDRVIYDPTNGGLYYDPDGTGAAAKVLVAALKKGLSMNAGDFLVI